MRQAVTRRRFLTDLAFIGGALALAAGLAATPPPVAPVPEEPHLPPAPSQRPPEAPSPGPVCNYPGYTSVTGFIGRP